MNKIPTWQERMPAPRAAFMCEMNCSGGPGMHCIQDQSCGDCMPVKVHGDSLAARDAEIADLRTALDLALAHAAKAGAPT